MNADEMNWLLQTIEEPETAKRFVQAQYGLGRIPYQLVSRFLPAPIQLFPFVLDEIAAVISITVL